MTMPTELEQALRAITPSCTAVRVKELRGLFDVYYFEEPCPGAATHAMHVVCDGAHDSLQPQLLCAEHQQATADMQARGARHQCICGGTILLELVAL